MLKDSFTIVLTLTILLLVGCGPTKKVVVAQQKQLPTWYKTPPLSNESDLYALGDGKDKKEAVANALNSMASTLSVSISSTYNAKTVVKEGRVNSSEGIYSSDLQSDVKKIRISNYELLHAESLGFKKYAVVIKSNKKRLFDGMLQEIKQNFTIIKEREQSVADGNALTKLSFYKGAKDSLENLPNTLIVMNVLNPSFDGSPYLQSMQLIESKYQNLFFKISFSISADANSINLKDSIAKALSAKKFKIKNAENKRHFTIYLKSEIEQANSYGFTLARCKLNIVTKDSNGVVIGSNTLNIVGQSSQGYGVAKQNLSYKLNALIAKEGVSKIMGLNI